MAWDDSADRKLLFPFLFLHEADVYAAARFLRALRFRAYLLLFSRPWFSYHKTYSFNAVLWFKSRSQACPICVWVFYCIASLCVDVALAVNVFKENQLRNNIRAPKLVSGPCCKCVCSATTLMVWQLFSVGNGCKSFHCFISSSEIWNVASSRHFVSSPQFSLEPKDIERFSPSKLDTAPFQNFTILDSKKVSLKWCL